jgi:hypothetical protein
LFSIFSQYMADHNYLNRTEVKRSLAVIGLAWISLQLIFIYRFGIETGFESLKYISEADRLIETGKYSSGNFLFYSVQIVLIAFSKISGSYPWFPVIFQMLINGISVYLFYKLCYRFSDSGKKALLFSLAFLAMYYYHLYNVYLFTESLFYSFGIIYSYFLFSMKKVTLKNIILIFLGITLIYFTRPTGVFFIPATIVYLIFRFYKKSALILLSAFGITGLIILYFLVNYALNSGGEFDFLLPYLDERIICGVPTIKGSHTITVPVEKDSIEGLWYIITNHTSLFLKLSVQRLLAFWGVIRPFYSLPHNIFIAVYFFSVYGLIIYNFRTLMKYFRPESFYFLCIISLVMITVILSCDEWHNRFIFALLPFFLIMASARKPGQNINAHSK